MGAGAVEIWEHRFVVEAEAAKSHPQTHLRFGRNPNLDQIGVVRFDSRVRLDRENGVLRRNARTDVRRVVFLRCSDQERIEVIAAPEHLPDVDGAVARRTFTDRKVECYER